MANGNGDDTMMVMVMMMILVLGGAGVYLFTRKKTELDVVEGPAGTTALVPTGLTYYPHELLGSTNPVFTIQESIKPAVPITGGSKTHGGIYRFEPYAKNTCQCDDYKCCYKGTYQPKYGNTENYTTCKEVYYGDPVDACARAVEQFNIDVDVLKENLPPTHPWWRRRTDRAVAKGLAARIHKMFY